MTLRRHAGISLGREPTLGRAFRAARTALVLCIVLVCSACEPGTAKIKGSTARVVGDRVTLELVEGDALFASAVELESASGDTYSGEELSVRRRNSGEQIELVIPAGIATGPARLRIGQQGADEVYEVPITIDRLAIFPTDNGELHLIPLPPATVEPRSFKFGTGPVLFSVSDDATTLALASGGELSLRRLTGRSEQHEVGVKLPGAAQALAALPNGAVVATTDTSVDPARTVVRRYELNARDELTEADSRVLQAATVHALAAAHLATSAPKAGALVECPGGGDCVAWIDFQVAPSAAELKLHRLDETSSAKSIAIGSDGRMITVPDTDRIYGLSFGASGEPRSSAPLLWRHEGAADPVGISRTRTLVGKPGEEKLEDIFATAERAQRTVHLFGAPNGDLRELDQPPTLGVKPLAIAFGPDRSIYILSETRQLQTITAGETAAKDDEGKPIGGYRAVNLAVPQGAIDLLVQR